MNPKAREAINSIKGKHLLALHEYFRAKSEDSGEPGRNEERSKDKNLVDALKSVAIGNHNAESDERLQNAVLEFVAALEARAGEPIMWKIAGGAVLLHEFVIPILPNLYELVKYDGVNGGSGARKIAFETQDMGFQRNRLYRAVNSGKVLLAISNGRRIDMEVGGNAGSDPTPYRHYIYDGKNAKVVLDAKRSSGNSGAILGRIDIGSFDYRLYMQPKLYEKLKGKQKQDLDWWTKIPLVLAHHCPCGKRSLVDIALAEGANVLHQCPGLPSALAAIQNPDSPYASILPSYISNINGLKGFDIGAPTNKLPEMTSYPHELKEHTISIIWKPSSIDEGSRSGAVLIEILKNLESRIAQSMTKSR